MVILIHDRSTRCIAELERDAVSDQTLRFRHRPEWSDLHEDVGNPEVVLAVLVFPTADRTGLETVNRLRRIQPDLPLLCLAPDPSPEWEWIARELGVTAVLPDVLPPGELLRAVVRLTADRRGLQPDPCHDANLFRSSS